MGYSFRLAARVILYASFHRQDNPYHDHVHLTKTFVKRFTPGKGDSLILRLNKTKIAENNIHLWGLRKDMFYLTTHSTHFIYVIWRHTYGNGPLR